MATSVTSGGGTVSAAVPGNGEIAGWGRRRHATGFWIVAFAFLVAMAFATVPAPLYVLYQARDGFPTFTTTLVFAAYSVGVMVALTLVGHLSDVYGRRTMIIVALGLEIVSAVLFLAWNDVSGLIVARFVSGLGVGALTAAATAYLGELRVVATGRDGAAGGAGVVASAVNLGGLGVGALIGGALAKFVGAPLLVPYVVFLVAIVVALVAMLFVPETVNVPTEHPPYRPQPVQAPAGKAAAFWAAGMGAFASFAVLGLFTSVVPSFLGTTFHVTDRLAAGATTFGVFAGAAVAQIVCARLSTRRQIILGTVFIGVGLFALAVAAVLLTISLFIVGAIIAGAGVGLLFRASIGSAGVLAEPSKRGGVLAAAFLIGYAGMTFPVIAVGALLLIVPTLAVLIGFVVVVVALAVFAGTKLVAQPR